MQYQALYRKYRPQRFDEVIGQQHVTSTLAREVQEGKVAHAYLFAGPRGTGKTTTARILAKALNCADPSADGKPCTDCDSCLAIAEGSSLDVIELDAASHNSVDDIREIRVNVTTVASMSGARRVYILDEAHMLSKAAGNALLKTLEEPPEHVYFVLATTEPYKLLDTVRSRSQRFDFHPVPIETLSGYLAEIASREDMETARDGLVAISRHAGGSVRDALSLLEQVGALGEGAVDLAGVHRALGLAEPDAYPQLARAIAEQDAPAALELVAHLAAQGADLRRFVSQAIGFFRGVFLAQYAPNLEEIVDEPDTVLEDWRAVAKELVPADVLRTVDVLGESLVQLREGRDERLVVELALLKLARSETATDVASLASRVGRLEDRVRRMTEGGGPVSPVLQAAEERTVPDRAASEDPEPGAETTEVSEAPQEEEPEEERVAEAAPPADLTDEQLETVWPALVAGVRERGGPRRHALFREVGPGGVEGSTVVLTVPAHLPFHLEQLREDEQLRSIVESTAAELLGGRVDVEYRPVDGPPAGEEQSEEVPDKDQLLEASDDDDPTSLVVDLLGGEVVEEIQE